MKGLLQFLQRKKGVDALIGVEAKPEGFSLAHVAISGKDERTLKYCEYHPCEDEPEKRTKMLEDLVHEHSLQHKACNFILSPSSYNLVLVEAPQVEAAELSQAVTFSIKDMIDFPIAEAAVDIFDLPEDGIRHGNKMVYAVAVKKEVVEQTIQMVEESGMELLYIDICEMALRNVSRRCPELEGNTAMLRLDRRSGVVNLLRDGQLYFARQFELTDDIYASAAQSQLVLELQRSFDYFERQMGQAPPRQIVCTGETLAEFEFSEDFQRSLSGTITKLNPFDLLECDGEFDPMMMHKSIEAIGGALRKVT